MFNARMDILRNEPPVIASNRLNAPFDCSANQLLKYSPFIPGTGSCEPIRITTIMAKVNRIFPLSSLILNAFFSVVSITSPLLFHQVPQSFLLQMH